MAKGVNLRSASLIRFGRGVTLERRVVIDGLMRKGVVLGDNVRIGAYSVLVGAPIPNMGEGISLGANSAVDAYSFIAARVSSQSEKTSSCASTLAFIRKTTISIKQTCLFGRKARSDRASQLR